MLINFCIYYHLWKSYISYDKIGRSESCNNNSAEDKLQDLAYNMMNVNIKKSETDNEKLKDENH